MPRILIADDSSASRRALRNLIEGNGWEVCGEAEDGLAAVERIAVLKPDLVILDFTMQSQWPAGGPNDPCRSSWHSATALYLGRD
jgi:CheY-like chemotaxis protein